LTSARRSGTTAKSAMPLTTRRGPCTPGIVNVRRNSRRIPGAAWRQIDTRAPVTKDRERRPEIPTTARDTDPDTGRA
jgi:hypothetical protein